MTIVLPVEMIGVSISFTADQGKEGNRKTPGEVGYVTQKSLCQKDNRYLHCLPRNREVQPTPEAPACLPVAYTLPRYAIHDMPIITS